MGHKFYVKVWMTDRIFRMSIEKDAKLVNSINNIVLVQEMRSILPFSRSSKQLVKRKDRIVAWVIRVVCCWAIKDLSLAISDGEIIRNRDGFVVGHKESVLCLRFRRPTPDPSLCSTLQQINRTLRTYVVFMSVVWLPFLVRPPAKLCRLSPFREKTVDAPRVHERVDWLGLARVLCVALRDVDSFDTQFLHEESPFLASTWLGVLNGEIGSDVEQGSLHHPTDAT
jgi:hypothetical protein